MTLWIAATCYDDGQREIVTYPTFYLNGRNETPGGLGAGVSVGVGTARRILTAASEDPVIFNVDIEDSFDWVAVTVAICPPAGPPAVTTQAATNVEVSTATLHGTVDNVNDTATDKFANFGIATDKILLGSWGPGL